MNTKNLKSLIEQVIRLEMMSLFEDAPPEATEDDPFGAYLFGDRRPDVDEPDTAAEEDFFQAIEQHIGNNSTTDLNKMMPVLQQLVQSGKYSKYLVPPIGQTVYRGISVSPTKAAELLGLSKEEISSKTSSTMVQVGSYNPMKGTDSWTLEFDVVRDFLGDDTVNIIFAAKTTDDGTWINNPYTMPELLMRSSANLLKREKEVFCTAQTPVFGAVFWTANDDNIYGADFYDNYDAAKKMLTSKG